MLLYSAERTGMTLGVVPWTVRMRQKGESNRERDPGRKRETEEARGNKRK